MQYVLWKPMINNGRSLVGLIQEQYSVRRRLLHGSCVQIIPVCPLLAPLLVCVRDISCEEWLLIVARESELVDGERDGYRGESDEEAALRGELATCPLISHFHPAEHMLYILVGFS